MYLADVDIRKHLPALAFEALHENHPFDEAKQVQPCSIDLRVDSIVWRAGKRGTIDLRRSLVQSIHPRRGWRASHIPEPGSIVIKPGQTVFARTYEAFRMPSGLAGKLEGRSSYARLGLFVHCTSDFINPGWHGRMPLQLYNAGPHTLRIPPYVHICQLVLVQLTQEPARKYGHADLDSKYQNDDGGPSFWWRDRRIKELHEHLQAKSLPMAIEKRVAELTVGREVEIIERFQNLIDRISNEEAQDPDTVIDRFARRERLRKWGRSTYDWLSTGIFVILLGLLITNIEGGQGLGKLWKLITATGLFGGASLYSWLRSRTGYLLPSDVEQHRLAKAAPRSLPPPTQIGEPADPQRPQGL